MAKNEYIEVCSFVFEGLHCYFSFAVRRLYFFSCLFVWQFCAAQPDEQATTPPDVQELAQNRLINCYTPILGTYIQQTKTASAQERAFASAYVLAVEGRYTESLQKWQSLLRDKRSMTRKEKGAIYREIAHLQLADAPHKALENYQRAAKYGQSNHPKLLAGQAAAYAKIGKQTQAELLQQKAAKYTKKEGEKYIQKIEAAFYEEKLPEAMIYTEHAISIDSTLAQAYYYRGVVLDILGTMVEYIIEACDKAIYYNRDLSAAYTLRARMLLIAKDTTAAVPDLEQALLLNSKDYKAHMAMGQLRIDQKNYQEALSHYKAVLKMYPADVDAQLGKANAYHMLAIQTRDLKEKHILYKDAMKHYENALITVQASIRLIEKRRKAWIFRGSGQKNIVTTKEFDYEVKKLNENLVLTVQSIRKKVKKIRKILREKQIDLIDISR